MLSIDFSDPWLLFKFHNACSDDAANQSGLYLPVLVWIGGVARAVIGASEVSTQVSSYCHTLVHSLGSCLVPLHFADRSSLLLGVIERRHNK